MDPLLTSLKKQIKSHRYLSHLTHNEINEILKPYIDVLKTKQYLTKHEELYDQYNEILDSVITKSRLELQNQFKIKIKIPRGFDKTIINFAMKNIEGVHYKKFGIQDITVSDDTNERFKGSCVCPPKIFNPYRGGL